MFIREIAACLTILSHQKQTNSVKDFHPTEALHMSDWRGLADGILSWYFRSSVYLNCVSSLSCCTCKKNWPVYQFAVLVLPCMWDSAWSSSLSTNLFISLSGFFFGSVVGDNMVILYRQALLYKPVTWLFVGGSFGVELHVGPGILGPRSESGLGGKWSK